LDSWSKYDYNPFIINHFLIFLITSITGTIITIRANSWWVGWLGMEINLLGFIILLINNSRNESSLKYFIVQSLRSVILISSALLTENFTTKKLEILIILAIFFKLGTAPLHFWLPIIVENITNYQLIFLLTWQKIAPLYLIFSLPDQNITNIFIISRLIIGAVSSLNELRIFTLITFSSINHTGWLLLSMLRNELISVLYIILYRLMVIRILLPINNKNSQSVWSLNNSNKYIIFINLLSLAGLPPFTGFIIKWILLSEIYLFTNNIINLLLILTSIILLYFYLRITINRFFKNTLYILNLNKNKQKDVIIFRIINLSGFYIILI